MTINEIQRLQVLAGIKSSSILEDEQAATPDIHSKEGDEVSSDDEANISIAGTEKGKYQRDNNIEPGTEDWFKLWFDRPYLTGRNGMKKKS